MISKWTFKSGFAATGIMIVAILFFTYVTMLLWNWLFPELFGIGPITYWKAMGLLLLCRLLFGWKSPYAHPSRSHVIRSRWYTMSPEERRNFSHRMHDWHHGENGGDHFNEKQTDESSDR